MVLRQHGQATGLTDRCRAAVAIAMLASACSDAPVVDTSRMTPEYGRDGRLTRLNYDRDGDANVDTWGYMDGARVLRVEVDENGDGKVDRWEFHRDGASGAPGGSGLANPPADQTVERIERATGHDGKITRREFFDKGRLTRVEEDTDGDGALDKWETYVNGALSTIALDTEHRGRPDRRLVYAADGSFLRIETDPDGSGVFRPLTP